MTAIINSGNGKALPELTRDISIWLDEYDDIFSDFDSRPYSNRVLSDDFINELNKVSKENDLKISELKLLIPEKSRNKETEAIITKRLHEFFRGNYHLLKMRRKKEIFRNVFFLVTGVVLMATASFLGRLRYESFFQNLLLMILEPGGWFLLWNSLDGIFNDLRKKKPELDFYAGMARCHVIFISFKV